MLKRRFVQTSVIALGLALFGSGLAGCSGSDGAAGATGQPGASGSPDAYETNTASGTLSQFAIASNGTLTLVGTGLAGTAGGAGTGPTDVAGSADGKFIYVHDGTGALSIFAISSADGTLTKSPDFVGIPVHAAGLIAL